MHAFVNVYYEKIFINFIFLVHLTEDIMKMHLHRVDIGSTTGRNRIYVEFTSSRQSSLHSVDIESTPSLHSIDIRSITSQQQDYISNNFTDVSHFMVRF